VLRSAAGNTCGALVIGVTPRAGARWRDGTRAAWPRHWRRLWALDGLLIDPRTVP
jgi:hypothetical protein